MEEMQERLKREYSGKELGEFLINECEEKIGNREIWICVENIFNLIIHHRSFIDLLNLGMKIKATTITDISCDVDDLTIYIENPFKGVD